MPTRRAPFSYYLTAEAPPLTPRTANGLRSRGAADFSCSENDLALLPAIELPEMPAVIAYQQFLDSSVQSSELYDDARGDVAGVMIVNRGSFVRERGAAALAAVLSGLSTGLSPPYWVWMCVMKVQLEQGCHGGCRASS